MEKFLDVGFLVAGWIFLVALFSVTLALVTFLGARTDNRISKLETELKEFKKEVRETFKEVLKRLPKKA